MCRCTTSMKSLSFRIKTFNASLTWRYGPHSCHTHVTHRHAVLGLRVVWLQTTDLGAHDFATLVLHCYLQNGILVYVPCIFCYFVLWPTYIPGQRDSGINKQTVYTATTYSDFMRIVATQWFYPNLMQLGNFIDVFLTRLVSGAYAHHQEHWMLSYNI